MPHPDLPQPEPIKADNVRIAAVGTGAWIAAFVVLLAAGLPEDERWWLWVCVTGTVIGVFACLYLPHFERGRAGEADAEPVGPAVAGATAAAGATADTARLSREPEPDAALRDPAAGGPAVRDPAARDLAGPADGETHRG